MTRKVTRRRFLKLALAGVVEAGVLTCGGLGYATAVEPNWLALGRVDVSLRGLPAALDGFIIVQLSDLHRGPEVAQEDIERAVELALRQEADLTVLTGDFVSRSADNAISCAEALAPLVGADEVLACFGNHDHWTHADTVAGALTEAGIIVLRNAAREVADGLWVAGVDDVWERHADLDEALAGVPSGAALVLLAHEPDYADTVAADGRVGLQISGHSHGGQVRWPFFGPPVLPYLGKKYHAGRYQVGDMWLYVNRGIGLISPAVRFNCRPEVTLLTLREGGV